jgi:amino acid transporter
MGNRWPPWPRPRRIRVAWDGDPLSAGALVATTSVTLTILYDQTRIVLTTMAQDGLVPGWFAKRSRRRAPARIALCLYLMTKIEAATWRRFGIWMLVGFVVDAAYGRRHARVRDAAPRVL